MTKNVYISIISMLVYFICNAQEAEQWSKRDFAKEIVKTLASEEFHGRGYVNDGDSLAAAYIERTFGLIGLRSFSEEQRAPKNYKQKFNFSVNTFPGKIGFSLSAKDKKTKKQILIQSRPGIDMLVGAGSPSIKGQFETILFDSADAVSAEVFEKFSKKLKKPTSTFIIIDDRGVTDKTKLEFFKKVKGNYFKTIGVIDFSKKLTHTVSQRVESYTEIKLLTDSFNLDFKTLKKCKVSLEIESQFVPIHATQNVIGYVEGSQYPDSFVVFSAHYDHLGQMGKDVYFPGANDNASGTAMLINLARYYSFPGNKPKYSIAFIAFAGEEAGLMGSVYYTNHPLFPLEKIRFLFNMDIMGTGDEGITVVNGTLLKSEYDKLVAINKEQNFLKEIKIRGKAANSDHYPFSEKGVKAFFIYSMGGIKAYHDVYDKAETLPLTKFDELFKLIVHFSDYLQHIPGAAATY